MKEIKLSQGKVALVDDADYEFLSKLAWHAHRYKDDLWYAYHSTYDGKKHGNVKMHQLLLQVGSGKIIDHKDGNGLNNQRSNLREADKSNNGANARLSKRNTTGFKGVVFKPSTGKYLAQTFYRGKPIWLGIHDNRVQAALAYDAAAKKLWGEFALTNEKLGLLPPP